MKQIELSTGTLLVANTPEGFTNGMVIDDPAGTWLIGYSYVGKLPSPGFQLLGHPSEISGEVLSTIIDNLLLSMYKTVPALLLTEYGIKKSDVLLFKPKNKYVSQFNTQN